MIARSGRELAAVLAGRVVSGSPDAICRGVSIDSRTVSEGDLFVAISGPRHDGHAFVAEAIAAGASGVLVHRSVIETGTAAVIEVRDTTDALGALAADERRRREIRVVAITGSSGKTSTRELTCAALSGLHRVAGSPGNLNNQWGLPLSLLRLPSDTEIAVLEMGMNHAGEIAALTRIASPTVGVITNVGSAHLGFFADLRALATAKLELFDEMSPSAIGVLDGDSPLLEELTAASPRTLIRFGLGGSADVRASEISGDLREGLRFRVDGQLVRIRHWGRHAVLNALAALAAARALGVSLAEAVPRLADVEIMNGRGRLHPLRDDALLVDDSYNANPTATVAVLEALAGHPWPGRRVAVLGDMLELGDSATEHHREVGRAAARFRITRLHAVGSFAGELAAGARAAGLADVVEHEDAAAASAAVERELARGDLVLVKGSRGVRLETVCQRLLTGSEPEVAR